MDPQLQQAELLKARPEPSSARTSPGDQASGVWGARDSDAGRKDQASLVDGRQASGVWGVLHCRERWLVAASACERVAARFRARASAGLLIVVAIGHDR